MNKIQQYKLNYFLIILCILFTIVLCSCQKTNKNSTPLEKKEIQTTDNNKKYLNFAPELELAKDFKLDLQNFKPVKTGQSVFQLGKGDNNPCAFAFDRKKYAYIGCNVTPARIVKFDMENMKEVSYIDLPSGENRDGCRIAALIALDSETIIHASYTNPCVFTKIDGNSMKITGTLKGDVEKVNDKYIRSMTYDGKYVYAATESTPAKIIVIDPKTMQKVDEVIFYDYPITLITSITICGNYLTGVSGENDTTKASIFRLSLSNIHSIPDYINIPSRSHYNSICTDGKNIYAGTSTVPTSVVKIDCSSSVMKFESSFEGDNRNECGNFSIVYDGNNVIVATWNLYTAGLDKLIKIDPDTMKRKAAINLPEGFPSDLMYLEPYVYTSCDKSPGKVIRIKF